MLSNSKEHSFVFTLKPKLNIKLKEKYEENKPTLTYDMLNYIATFINVLDTFTLISYVMAFPCSMYEIKKKFIEYYKSEKSKFEIAPSCLYKFMNEPLRILTASLIPIFGTYGLLNYCAQDHKKVLSIANGRSFVIHLVKEQNKAPSREIYRILNQIECPPKTMHRTFSTLDILYNSQIALLSRYVQFADIDNYIYKKLKSYYTFSNIKCLNTNERALLMFHYDENDNFNSKFIGKESLRHKLIVEALKSNYLKIIDILFENRLIYIYNPSQKPTEVDLYIGNLKIDSEEFNKSKKIIKYYLDRLIDFYNYEDTICNMLNYSFSINNNEMVKYLLSLNGARKGISTLLGSRYGYGPKSHLINLRDSSKDELDRYQEFTLDVFVQSDFIFYDFLINNLPNDNDNDNIINIDINVLTKYTTINESINLSLHNKYIFIIEKYMKEIEEIENSENAEKLDDQNYKYYCSRETLINMYNILLFPSLYIELQKKLKKEFDELMEKEESNQPTNQMLREYIKALYSKIRIRQKQTCNAYILMKNVSNSNMYGCERHKLIDIFIAYLIEIPEYLIDNEVFKNKAIEKINEFLNANVNESYIETAHMMQTLKKYKEILQNMFGS